MAGTLASRAPGGAAALVVVLLLLDAVVTAVLNLGYTLLGLVLVPLSLGLTLLTSAGL